MSKISVDLYARVEEKWAKVTKPKRINPTKEQLAVAFQAALEVLDQIGQAAVMVEVIKVYFYQDVGVSESRHLHPCFEVVMVEPWTRMKFEVHGTFAWSMGDMVAEPKGLAGLLVESIQIELEDHILQNNDATRKLGEILQSMKSAA